uniref:hypothetical protein n=1 Tax=Sedimenticola sp. TaxID=1940285 RepID=UPI003D0F7608
MKSSRTGYLRPGADTRSLSQTLKGFALGTLVLAGGALSATAADAAIRVGPTDPDTGFPLWYEDESGLRLDLCTDLTSCFFELPDPGLPVSFPDNFPDEAFYWAAEAALDGGPNDTGTRAILVMAREAAFFNEGVVDGDQI